MSGTYDGDPLWDAARAAVTRTAGEPTQAARLAALEERMVNYERISAEVMRDTIAELRARLVQAEADLAASRGETRYYRETLARESGLAE